MLSSAPAWPCWPNHTAASDPAVIESGSELLASPLLNSVIVGAPAAEEAVRHPSSASVAVQAVSARAATSLPLSYDMRTHRHTWRLP